MNTAAAFYHSTIGKKAIMAITGFIWVGYVIGHMAGNLQVFQGPEAINNYAVFLRQTGGLLWAARATLLVAIVLHIIVAIQLVVISRHSRNVRYEYFRPREADLGSRTMRWTGPVLLIFLIYHLLHMTWGVRPIHPDFEELQPYHNVVTAFSNPLVSLLYIAAMFALGFHLYHGVWSMFQSLGWNNTKFHPLLRRLAIITTIVVVVGFIAVPIAVLTGAVGPS